MANYIVQDTSLATVADAIRAKTGISAKLEFPIGWKAAVDGIQSGIGGEDLDAVLTEQDGLIERIQTALQGKTAGGGENLDEVLTEQDSLIERIQAAIAAKAAK